MENALTAELRKLLLQSGADLMGVGDLRSLPEDQRRSEERRVGKECRL